jgi:hypothetical protein
MQIEEPRRRRLGRLYIRLIAPVETAHKKYHHSTNLHDGSVNLDDPVEAHHRARHRIGAPAAMIQTNGGRELLKRRVKRN